MASLLGQYFPTFYSFPASSSDSWSSLCSASPCTPLAQGLFDPNSFPECTLSSSNVLPMTLPAHLLPDHGDPSKGREELYLHLVLTSPLCYKCEQGCSFRPAVKVALGYGYISTRNWCEVANSFTKTRKELKSCWMLKASSQYSLDQIQIGSLEVHGSNFPLPIPLSCSGSHGESSNLGEIL